MPDRYLTESRHKGCVSREVALLAARSPAVVQGKSLGAEGESAKKGICLIMETSALCNAMLLSNIRKLQPINTAS